MKVLGSWPRLRSRDAGKSSPGPKLYNTFEGVFKPTLLTILGVIMYLRVGWVVGNAGLMGGWLVMLAAMSITLSTGLSISSIATNTRIKAGGPYAMMSKSLGVEIGSSIGVPLFLSQALAVAMYLFGFREGWQFLFPNHPAILVDLLVFAAVFTVAYISAGLAFRIQYLVMALIILSLISIFASPAFLTDPQPMTWWGEFPGAPETGFTGITFWGVFAVFFPATTGIMSGVNMSGELKNSRKSIPMGTLAAIGVSCVVYLALAWWAARAADPEALVNNYTIMVDKAFWSPAVLAGLLAATFSAALSSMVGAPRILNALARDKSIPYSNRLAKLSRNGEPRRALMVSGVITLIGILIRDLNAIAPLITMFFLITYATVNLVVLVESSLGLINFRPTFRLTRWVPLYGFITCLLAMVIINPVFSLGAIVVVFVIYLRQVGQPRERRQADVRSGILAAIAQWAAKKVVEFDITNVRAWKPIMLVPVENKSQLLGEFRLLLDLSRPEGSIKLLGLAHQNRLLELDSRLQDLGDAFRRRGVFTTYSVLSVKANEDIHAEAQGVLGGLQALQSDFFRPNVLFLRMPEHRDEWDTMLQVFEEAVRLNVGVTLFGRHPAAGLGRAEVVNLWITPQLDDASMPERLNKGSINLAILMAIRLFRAWQGTLNLISVVPDEVQIEVARQYINTLQDLCRIPGPTNVLVMVGSFEEGMVAAPQSDMDILGLQSTPDYEFVHRMIQLTGSSCLFVRDSGSESALA
jgi:solute carrier family 12 sodium/potassium/chloride transporter 2